MKRQLWLKSIAAFITLSSAIGAASGEPMEKYYPGSCSKVFQSGMNRRVKYAITLNNPEPTPQAVDSVKTIVDSINRTMTGYLNLPQSLHLRISQTSDQAWHMAGSNDVSVPFQKVFVRTRDFRQEWSEIKSKHPVFTQAIVAHEYGHALFEENIGDNVNRYLIAVVPKLNEADLRAHDQEVKGWNDKIVNLQKRKQEVVDQQRDLLFNHNPFPQKEYDLLSDEFYKLNRQIDRANDEIAKLLPLSRGLDLFNYKTPYSELYADIVAVLYAGKLTAVKDSLTFSGATKEAQQLAKYRDFSADIKTQGWSKSEAHDLFGPVRSYLGRYVFSDPQLRKDKNWLLHELTQVILEEMTARAENSQRLTQATPEELNTRLIERIRTRFSSL